jgi:bifunctional pyridoxal-dependent enzyme with beta-cystathionase and maltose regulon repressor activities
MNTLTYEEIQARTTAKFDLGAGYSQIDLPEYLKALLYDEHIAKKSDGALSLATGNKYIQPDERLNHSVLELFDLNADHQIRCYSTFSGSVALDRAMAATQSYSRYELKPQLIVVTTTPSIDIIRHMLNERADITSIFVESNAISTLGNLDAFAFVQAMRDAAVRHPSASILAIISSPENPTGAIWTAEQLQIILEACNEIGGVLIVDHCFAIAGIHVPEDVPLIWNVAGPGCKWIGIWDTGKTMALNGEKLGFIICRSDALKPFVSSSLNVLQVSVSERAKALFAGMIELSKQKDYMSQLRSVCKANLEHLDEVLGATFMRHPCTSGSLAMMDIGILGREDEDVRRLLLQEGVGVIACRVFFHSEWKKTNFIRIALARNPAYFRKGVSIIAKTLLGGYPLNSGHPDP